MVVAAFISTKTEFRLDRCDQTGVAATPGPQKGEVTLQILGVSEVASATLTLEDLDRFIRDLVRVRVSAR